jgi:hypothetical protein
MKHRHLAFGATVALLALLTTGCAQWLTGTDTSGKDRDCVAKCDADYSSCRSGGGAIGSQTVAPAVCSPQYASCLRSCPAK